MTADERRQKAIEEYYTAYMEYKQLDTIREHVRIEISGDTLIEIYRHYCNQSERILRVTQKETEGAEISAEVAAYEQATDLLADMIKERRRNIDERRLA